MGLDYIVSANQFEVGQKSQNWVFQSMNVDSIYKYGIYHYLRYLKLGI